MKKTAAFFILGLIILMPLSAGNRYPAWNKIHTKHFTLVFEENSRESAEEIAGFCEEVYTKVTGFFGSYPENILCIIHGSIDTSNGDFYPLPLELNLYTTSPSTPLIGARDGNWLKMLLTHELTHYVNLTYQGGFFYHLSKLLGPSISTAPGAFMPGWAVEGIAVKLETELTNGGRGRNPFFEMESKAQIIQDNFYSWEQAAYTSRFPPYDRIYQAGYLINDYLSRRYGDDVFVRIYNKFTAFPPLGFDYAVKAVTGKSVKDIFQSMKRSLQQKYMVLRSAPGIPASPDVIGNYYLPVITEKGWILYRSTQNSKSALVLFNPGNSTEKIIRNVYLHDFASFTADKKGGSVVFAAFDAGTGPSGETLTSDLFLVHPGKPGVTRITKRGHLWQPALSPDGTRLVAVQKQGQYSRLVETDICTGDIRPVFSRPSTNIHTPSFSPDGRNIVFTINDRGKQEIAVLDRYGETKIISASLNGEKYFPRFAGSSSVIFSADTGGSLALYLFSRDGTIQKICEDPVGAYAGSIHKNRILYASYSSKGYCLKTKALSSQKSRTLLPAAVTILVPEKETKHKNTLQETPCIDFPKFLFWFPIPVSLDPFDPENISPAPGFVSYFRSPRSTSDILTGFSLLTDPLQPEGSISVNVSWGNMLLHYALNEGYSSSAITAPAAQTTMQELSVTIPFIQRYLLGTQSLLSGTAGVLSRHTLYDKDDFSFYSAKEGIPAVDYLYAIAGFNSALTQSGSTMDIIAPKTFSFSSMFFFPVRKESFPFPGWRGNLSFSFSPFLKHQVLRGSCKWGYSTFPRLSLHPGIRGGFHDNLGRDGSFIAGLDYLFTLGIMDVPIFRGFSLQGIAGGIHVEKAFGFSLPEPDITTDHTIYAGMELTFFGGYTSVTGKGGIGINVKLDTENPEVFNPAEDFGLYIYVGTDSFMTETGIPF